MFDHVTIRAADRDASERFYRTVLSVLGLDPVADGAGFLEWDDFSIAQATRDAPATRNLHVAFPAPDRRTVDAFHAAALAAGHPDNGAPGLREQYGPGCYGAFALAPDGTNVESVHHGR